MFNIGIGELLVVLVVAFVVVGPDDLPKVARWLGTQIRRLRVLLRDIKAETGWDEVEKEVQDVQREVRQTVRELDVTGDLRQAAKDVKGEIDGISRDMKQDFRQLNDAVKSETRALDDEVREAVGPTDQGVGSENGKEQQEEIA